jgi:hypothetical protein
MSALLCHQVKGMTKIGVFEKMQKISVNKSGSALNKVRKDLGVKAQLLFRLDFPRFQKMNIIQNRKGFFIQ